MKKTSLADADCRIARALAVVGDLWSLLIVRQALQGTRRFNEFATHLGLARNILAGRLKKLVEHEILEIVPASDGSAYNEYVLTPKGRDLFVTLVSVWQWSQRWIDAEGGAQHELIDAREGKPVAPVRVLAHDGRALRPQDVRLVDRAPEKIAS